MLRSPVIMALLPVLLRILSMSSRVFVRFVPGGLYIDVRVRLVLLIIMLAATASMLCSLRFIISSLIL